MCPVILPRLLLRVSSDHPKRRRPNQDGLHHTLRGICLQDHVLCVEERWCNLAACDTTVLFDQLHRNVEAYVDDVVIKTKTQDQFITDLEETFNSLRKFRWKLNPTKCPLENYLDSSSATEESRLIQRRSMPSWPWTLLLLSRMCRSLQAAWHL